MLIMGSLAATIGVVIGLIYNICYALFSGNGFVHTEQDSNPPGEPHIKPPPLPDRQPSARIRLLRIRLSVWQGNPLPWYLDLPTELLAKAFAPCVLFLAGAATVGSFSELGSIHSAVLPALLVALQSLVLPFVVRGLLTLFGSVGIAN